MQRHTHSHVVYYTFDSFRDSGALVHAISTRHGGVSPAPFDTLNLSRMVGDGAANVTTNLARWHAALALDAAATVDASQAQADQIARVDARHRGTRIKNVDALLTDTPNLPLMLRFADCVPILLYDPTHRAIGVAHAGWRGTVLKIATRAVQAMGDAFGTRPRDLIAGIAPSIGPCCYRVGDEVIVRVRDAFDDADELFVQQNGNGVHLDLWQANAQQLRALGVEQIEIANLCTAHRTDDFFSWRAERGKTGRFSAVIAIRNPGTARQGRCS
ncbi:MAG: peptidoglycan editing factor PgeF [Chloroflexi bacterium]|nr:peptidoglycan editing factor PgeF [Chloroflexota bacterium]